MAYTIGDGRYGTEANYLISRGLDALATDYSDKLLKLERNWFYKQISKRKCRVFNFQRQ